MAKIRELLAKALSTLIGVGIVAAGYGSAIYRNSHVGASAPTPYKARTDISTSEENSDTGNGRFSMDMPEFSSSANLKDIRNATSQRAESIKGKVPEYKSGMQKKASDMLTRLEEYESRKIEEFDVFIHDCPQKITIPDDYGVERKFNECFPRVVEHLKKR